MQNNTFWRQSIFLGAFVLGCFFLAGCLRVSGSAGVAYPKDGETVYKTASGELDSARLLPNGAAS